MSDEPGAFADVTTPWLGSVCGATDAGGDDPEARTAP